MERKRVLNVQGGTPGALHMIHGHLFKVSHVLFSHNKNKPKSLIRALAFIYIYKESFIWVHFLSLEINFAFVILAIYYVRVFCDVIVK